VRRRTAFAAVAGVVAIADDEDAGRALRAEYLDPLWRSSRDAAIVLDAQGTCNLR